MAKDGFITNWKVLEEALNVIAKQHYIKAKRLETRIRIISIITMKALATTLFVSIPSSSSKSKTIDEDTLEESMKGMKELKIEMNALK